MSKDTDPDVNLSDGRTSPSTSPQVQQPQQEPEPIDEEGPPPSLPVQILRGALSGLKDTYTKVDNQLPIPVIGAIGIVLAYFSLLALIGFMVTPFHSFGLLSLTTGVLILTILYHPEGEISPETTVQEYFYPATGVSFIFVGLRYLLMGVLFDIPFA